MGFVISSIGSFICPGKLSGAVVLIVFYPISSIALDLSFSFNPYSVYESKYALDKCYNDNSYSYNFISQKDNQLSNVMYSFLEKYMADKIKSRPDLQAHSEKSKLIESAKQKLEFSITVDKYSSSYGRKAGGAPNSRERWSAICEAQLNYLKQMYSKARPSRPKPAAEGVVSGID